MKRVCTIVVIVVLFYVVGIVETHYTRDTTVVDVDNDVVTVVDTQGHLWKLIGTGYTENQEVTIVLHNNYTDSIIADDRIVGCM